jgi:hypothetical protein
MLKSMQAHGEEILERKESYSPYILLITTCIYLITGIYRLIYILFI